MSLSGSRAHISQQLLAICGIAGPISYAIVVIVLGSLQPGYSHVRQSMSQLGAVDAPNAMVMNTAGFALLGLLLIAFSVGLHRGVSEGRGSKIGPALVALSGAALIMTGLFRCDPGCVDVTAIGTTHSVFAVIAASALMLAPLAISPRLIRDSRWQGYQYYSWVTAIVVGAFSALYGVGVFEQWTGLLQRLAMGPALLWVEVMAIRLLRLSSRRPRGSAAP